MTKNELFFESCFSLTCFGAFVRGDCIGISPIRLCLTSRTESLDYHGMFVQHVKRGSDDFTLIYATLYSLEYLFLVGQCSSQ